MPKGWGPFADTTPMGRKSGGSRLPALFLLALLVGVGILVAPRGLHPSLDRAKSRAEKTLEEARGSTRGKPESRPAPAAPAAGVLRTVVRVVDGDTVVLDGNEKVRLIGINTPESVDPRRPVQRFGKEASAYAKALLQGKRVRVEHDVEKKDRYGRTLAYLHLEDGTFVNLRLVQEGYASAYRYPPNVRHAEEFRLAERRAREGKKGMWGDAPKAGALVEEPRR
jgi:endonuclease YncB( thermonuclease family)